MTRIHPRNALLIAGLSLLAGCMVLQERSAGLVSTDVAGAGRTSLLVAILSAMGCVFLWTTSLIARLAPADASPLCLATCVLIGLLMRLSQLTATPIYEKDYLRYLWDGAVFSSGVDPYKNTPGSIGTKRLLCSLRRGPAPGSGTADDCILSDLANESKGLVNQISYGYVTTIYPPIAQIAFAAAYRIQPFSLEAWRGVLLGAELLSVTTLIAVLLGLRENPLWVIAYWWNPTVIMHIANGAHIEALLVPFLVLALWAIASQRAVVAAIALAVAAAIKIWPLLLLPGVLSASSDARRNLHAASLGATLAGLLLWPQLRHLGSDSGMAVFSTEWMRNAFVFPLLVKAWKTVNEQAEFADHAARITVLVVVLLVSLRSALSGPADLRVWARRWGICVAALFLLVPTGYPWYFIGVLPFLCFWRAAPLLMLPITLPFYFAHYILGTLKDGAALSGYLSAAEFIPVWAGFGWMAWRRKIQRTDRCSSRAPSANLER